MVVVVDYDGLAISAVADSVDPGLSSGWSDFVFLACCWYAFVSNSVGNIVSLVALECFDYYYVQRFLTNKKFEVKIS